MYKLVLDPKQGNVILLPRTNPLRPDWSETDCANFLKVWLKGCETFFNVIAQDDRILAYDVDDSPSRPPLWFITEVGGKKLLVGGSSPALSVCAAASASKPPISLSARDTIQVVGDIGAFVGNCVLERLNRQDV